ncbi:hypothetical protein DACRYDRAFT_21913 [Dacryopinax primogenitus]|uniref:Pre-mRNA-splicing factor CWC26 n=1 Tax=Dacryopinax primogenitus (strain DJM 731) TaxID=1858805 RepID=M5G1S4_DACPD|nr:uncharacterized protein DACRYDRAFT_21913 [Dacryopinax primogenitus]EJU02170.1 hypothetical protein DACRYDRAFT_21913 [Dacryopinax primogenitus]
MDEEDAPEFVEESKGFRKKKGGGWQTIREPSPPDEQPQVVLPDGKPVAPTRTRPKSRSPSPVVDATDLEQETVYRDASGRKINLSIARAEKKRKEREEAEKIGRRMEWGKGVIQRQEAEQRRNELHGGQQKNFSRSANDTDMNKHMKEEQRWSDPAAAFLTKKKLGPKRPAYSGPLPPPNRFCILPGYRWDGVDRGNGFEKKLFQRQNERQRTGLEAYQWSVDDM